MSPSSRRAHVVCAFPYALDRVPSQRFRWEQWAPLLEEYGVDVTFVPFSSPELDTARRRGEGLDALRRAARRYPSWMTELLDTALDADVVVIHRNAALAGPPVAEMLLGATDVPIVYDLDDAIYLAPEDDTLLRKLVRSDWRVAAISRMATTVSAGNPILAEYCGQYCDDVVIWPTTVAMSEYTQRPDPEPDALPCIGWTGSTSTAMYVEGLMPVLKEVYREEPFELLVIGADIDLHGIEGECIPWSPEVEIPGIQRMDIGLMPLTDTKWSRGKCGLKAMQYLAVGSPAVVSDVGVNRDIVLDGECGFVVKTPEQWKERLLTLLRDPALRRAMGARGREHVRDHYSAEAWAPRIAAKLKRLSR